MHSSLGWIVVSGKPLNIGYGQFRPLTDVLIGKALSTATSGVEGD